MNMTRAKAFLVRALRDGYYLRRRDGFSRTYELLSNKPFGSRPVKTYHQDWIERLKKEGILQIGVVGALTSCVPTQEALNEVGVPYTQ